MNILINILIITIVSILILFLSVKNNSNKIKKNIILEKKIFNISFHKNGTSSFHTLMKMNNLKSIHMTSLFMKEVMNLNNHNITNDIINYSKNNINVDPKIKINNFIDNDKLFNFIEKYTSFSDTPFCWLYELLHKKYPDALFVYIYRDSEVWYNSMKKYFKSRKSLIRQIIYGYSNPSDNKEKYISVYKKHMSDVTKYFKNNKNFIKIDLYDPLIGKKINKFCKLKEDLPFPKKNKTK